jgi:hypothetical protein
VQEAFPWHSSDYDGYSGGSIAARIEKYKRQRWKNLAAASTNSPGIAQQTSPRRGARSWLGEINLPQPGTKTAPLRPIPARTRDAGPSQLDLTSSYNVALNECWQPAASLAYLDRDLRRLPAGCQTFTGVVFDVRGLAQLRRASSDFELFPDKVAVPAKGAFQRLHCLHGTREEAEHGTAIAGIVLHYSDGTTAELPVIYGEHLRAVTTPTWREPECKLGQVAWQDSRETDTDWQPRVYKTTFANPNPGLAVSKIEYVSKLTRSGPFLLALTTE